MRLSRSPARALYSDLAPVIPAAVARDKGQPVIATVDCPDCDALAGEQCVTAAGNRTSSHHISRRRMAKRKLEADK